MDPHSHRIILHAIQNVLFKICLYKARHKPKMPKKYENKCNSIGISIYHSREGWRGSIEVNRKLIPRNDTWPWKKLTFLFWLARIFLTLSNRLFLSFYELYDWSTSMIFEVECARNIDQLVLMDAFHIWVLSIWFSVPYIDKYAWIGEHYHIQHKIDGLLSPFLAQSSNIRIA